MTHTKKIILTLSGVLLAACAAKTEIVDLDAQTKGYHISCGSLPPFESYDDCAQRASAICGNQGFSILKQTDSSARESDSIWSNGNRDMLVKCNAPAAYAPDSFALPQ